MKASLKEQGFGIITEIDMHSTLEEKLGDVDMKPYRILGACNPKYAYQTLQKEENIGLFLPCKVLIKQTDENRCDVVMVNPSASSQTWSLTKTPVTLTISTGFQSRVETQRKSQTQPIV